MKKTFLLTVVCGVAAMAQSYSYDAAGRLIRVAYPNGNGIVYTYDAADNLTLASPIVVPVQPMGVNARQTQGGVRLAWDRSSGATSYQVLRRAAGAAAWGEVATTSQNSYLATDGNAAGFEYQVVARNANGASVESVPVSVSTRSAVSLTVPPGGAAAVVTEGIEALVRGGSVKADVEAGSVPYGVAVFGFRQNGVLVTEAGVPPSPPTRRARIFIDSRPNVASATGQYQATIRFDTGFGLSNPGEGAAFVNLTLRDPAGAVVATARGRLGAGAHTANLLSNLDQFAPDFRLPGAFGGLGSLDIESDQPVSVMALRATINQRNEVLFTSIPVADLASPLGSGVAVFPHLAEGGGYNTAVLLMNTSGQTETGVVQSFTSAGAPLALAWNGQAAASQVSYTLPPGGVVTLETSGASPEVSAGWMRLTPSTGPAPAGAGIFRWAQGGNVVSETGIAAAALTTHARLYVDRSNGHDMGIAIANPSGGTNRIRAQAIEINGETAASGVATFTLAAQGHRADLAGGVVGGLPAGFQGMLDMSSDTPFAALELRATFNARNELLWSTFPVADQTNAAPSPVVFPHIADGGGFTTELILYGPVSGALVRVRYAGDDGRALEAAKLPE